jgi:uncharacterized membrane protein (UPF0127 family)
MRKQVKNQTPPTPYNKLYLGIAFLIIAIIAVILILVLPDNVSKPMNGFAQYAFKKEGTALFLDKSERIIAFFDIEIAETPDEMKTGLMYRDSLSLKQAMLFIYDKPDILSFWMKNTYLPLDMVFIGADSSIVSIGEKTTPFSEQSIVSKGPAQFVLEINAGLASAYGLKIGDKFSWARDKN